MPILLVVMAVVCQKLFAQQANEKKATDSKDRNDSIPTREEIVRGSVLTAEAEKRRDSLIMLHSDIIDQQVIPEDTSVRTGVLKNGLTYYVRRCTEPKEKRQIRQNILATPRMYRWNRRLMFRAKSIAIR